ncbi:MAG: hypothetical protein JKY52_12355 [Flavobacteriales bacterium]|nr:hypothetical protein [Flavobacteriales bacterium]
MKQILLNIFLILLLIGCQEKLEAEYVFFEDCDFDTGGYKLLVYGDEGEWIEDYRDFYIDDVETLKRMQKQWVFKYKSDVKPCGYGYHLKLVDGKKVLKSKSVNIDCEYMSGWVYFPKLYLTEHKNSFKKMTESDREEFSQKYYRAE